MANGNGNGRRKRRRWVAVAAVAVVVLAALGLVAARSGGKEIDPSRLASVEKGDLARSSASASWSAATVYWKPFRYSFRLA